jgi:hypothetical protein
MHYGGIDSHNITSGYEMAAQSHTLGRNCSR